MTYAVQTYCNRAQYQSRMLVNINGSRDGLVNIIQSGRHTAKAA